MKGNWQPWIIALLLFFAGAVFAVGMFLPDAQYAGFARAVELGSGIATIAAVVVAIVALRGWREQMNTQKGYEIALRLEEYIREQDLVSVAFNILKSCDPPRDTQLFEVHQDLWYGSYSAMADELAMFGFTKQSSQATRIAGEYQEVFDDFADDFIFLSMDELRAEKVTLALIMAKRDAERKIASLRKQILTL
tara:strand:- start:59 stop:637 length:579 start_codon:yes stop_codon:yes gene_type:complete